ncbi:hypothetical protein MSAN_01791100 [Mycena sanguinolenta]|uniref:Uncharacterized protein n=1 Tax=Mycena sanguinolenta TaxID=230812 RepID=A0A8H7CUE7_9AGAR|nr:hypothetical protein MSAN_01791100 [Mycena sanguinolenta]
MALPAYTKPTVFVRDGTNVADWELKSFTQPAPTYNQFEPPPPPADVVADADRSFRVPDAAFDQWVFSCRIYSRNLIRRSADGTPLNNGVLLASSWTQATAWFVNAAHTPADAPARWMLTAAHNFVNMVPKHDVNGRITNFGLEEPAFADAIYIVAGWGHAAIGVYANRVSIMKGYSDNVAQNIHLDGAALYIAAPSPIPAGYWNNAPQVAALPRAPDPPCSCGEHQPLQGMYLAGQHTNAAGTTINDFGPVVITRTRDSTGTGGPNHLEEITLQFDEGVVHTAQGVSGSPMVVLAAGVQTILGSVNTSGIVAGFSQPLAGRTLEAVDPVALLKAVYSVRMGWQDFNPGPLGVWRVLRRE